MSEKIIKKLDKWAKEIARGIVASQTIKEFSMNLIELSKELSDAYADYELYKSSLEVKLDNYIQWLLNTWTYKYKNKAETRANTHYKDEILEEKKKKVYHERLKLLYRSYNNLFLVAHQEFKHLAQDMATTNMNNQYHERAGKESIEDIVSQVK